MVCLERVMACIDGDRDWTDGGNGLFESFFISLGYVNETGQTGGYLRFGEIAGTVLNIYTLTFNTRNPYFGAIHVHYTM